MKIVQGLIYLPNVGKAVSKVAKFLRCPQHGNVLAWLGRPLSIDEFNALAPTLLTNAPLYGMQPMVKLVEVEVEMPELEPEKPKQKPQDDTGGNAKEFTAQSSEQTAEAAFIIEPMNDGFVVVDLRGEAALYRGQGEQWETDISLVTPFANEAEASAAIPQQALDATKPKEPTLSEAAAKEAARLAKEQADAEKADAKAKALAEKKAAKEAARLAKSKALAEKNT